MSEKIELKHYVKLCDRTLTTLTMKRPTIGDLIDYPIKNEQDMQGELNLYAHLCGINPEDMREIDAEDYAQIQKQYLLFRGLS